MSLYDQKSQDALIQSAGSLELAQIAKTDSGDPQREKNEIEPRKSEDGSNITRTEEDKPEYPRGVKMFLIVMSLCLAIFLMALEYLARPCQLFSPTNVSAESNSIISTAIPKITDEFQSLDDVGWYGSGSWCLHPMKFHRITI